MLCIQIQHNLNLPTTLGISPRTLNLTSFLCSQMIRNSLSLSKVNCSSSSGKQSRIFWIQSFHTQEPIQRQLWQTANYIVVSNFLALKIEFIGKSSISVYKLNPHLHVFQNKTKEIFVNILYSMCIINSNSVPLHCWRLFQKKILHTYNMFHSASVYRSICNFEACPCCFQ